MTAPAELKPCPFCGGEAEATGIEKSGDHHIIWPRSPERFTSHWIRCSSCSQVSTQHFKTLPEAIAAWNRRAEPEGAGRFEEWPELEDKQSVLMNLSGGRTTREIVIRQVLRFTWNDAYAAGRESRGGWVSAQGWHIEDGEVALCWGRRGYEVLKFRPASDREAKKWRGRNVGEWANPITGSRPAAQPSHIYLSLPDPPDTP